ncbi:LacI family DNA-binding transcriptional regulator [Roseivivax marinus]|nr:LacI family DNA-binding transcriptional regulator [Roseivivax marinus]UMA66668.1 LacI family DNA-binding transcriptional regulator [Roseivivax marinus]
MAKNRITLDDVARAAGVSAITASRALRQPEKVSESARARILSAVQQLGYVPDAAASALASTRTSVVGLLVPSLTNAVFADFLRGVYDAIEDTSLTIQIGNFRYSPSKEEALIRTFLHQRPAGLIVAGVNQTDAARRMLMDAPCPVVQTMETSDQPVDRIIGFSQYASGEMVARHLIDAGYRRPGLLGARMDPRAQARIAGYRSGLQAVGLDDARRMFTTPQPSSVGMGGQLLSDLLAVAPDTDAVFCANDDLAAGALFEAQRRGMRVPDSFGICGFNDLEMSRHMVPPLTSVSTPRYEVGRGAIDLIRAALDPASGDTPRRIELDVSMSLRGTTRSVQTERIAP